jgi:putative peptidoglycan lipid II flippase
VTALILVAAAYLVAFAPVVVAVLLEHGRFSAADTAATASIMRVYALGLLGQAMVGVLCRPFFTGARPSGRQRAERSGARGQAAGTGRHSWYPAVAMAVGLAVTTGLAVLAVPFLGAAGIAAANGTGISVTAVLLLAGLRRCGVTVSFAGVGSATVRLAAAAAGAAAVGWLAATVLSGLLSIVVGGVVVLAAFGGFAYVLRCDEVIAVASLVIRRVRRVR